MTKPEKQINKLPRSFIYLTVLILSLAAAFAVWGVPYFFQPPQVEGISGTYGTGTLRARVVEILEEGQAELEGFTQNFQVMRVELLEGEYKGILMEVEYGRRQVRPDFKPFAPGDEIFITLGKRPDGVLSAFYVEYVRSQSLFVLLGVFVAAILLISGWKGLRALLAMAFSLLIIIGYIIPHILAGEDPVTISLIGSAILLGVSLYVTYGWNLKTHASVLSMILVLILTGTLAVLFVSLTRLSGYGSEDALFLAQMSGVAINLRGLLLGGLIIGALGVLDDLVTTQSSAVFELHHANPAFKFWELFRTSMRIGQDHVAATVNTLILAYAGASLPTLLLFTLGKGNYGFLLNTEMVAEEIVRTLVGSLGLVAAVPITTVIAVFLALFSHRLGWLRPFLGPETGSGEHGHHH
ncbi:MAG: YibE/F family protein [Chloroflexi bacterium HGW-Chloroflexi-6]|nr:MAG: YibE/F family protein [Chloroflexi bacterium HGW-Chloroflexi-6]